MSETDLLEWLYSDMEDIIDMYEANESWILS
jgi:hypothetical protein